MDDFFTATQTAQNKMKHERRRNAIITPSDLESVIKDRFRSVRRIEIEPAGNGACAVSVKIKWWAFFFVSRKKIKDDIIKGLLSMYPDGATVRAKRPENTNGST